MATFDQLSAEQRAIVELVLKQGQTYAQLEDMLRMPAERVRELARDSLVTLSPVSAAQVEEDWRGQVADYLLGQQSASESAATREHLRRSEAARAWARSMLDSLDQFYVPANMPTIPEGEARGGAEPRRPRREKQRPGPQSPSRGREPPREEGAAPPEEGAAPRDRLSPEARRRRVAGAGALALVALLAVLVWKVGLVGLLTGNDGGKADAQGGERASPSVIGQLVLKPKAGKKGVGAAFIARDKKGRLLVLVQARVAPNKDREVYEVWLYNSSRDARSLGARVTNQRGIFQGARVMPKDFARYRLLVLSRENVDDNHRYPRDSVLRGRIADFTAPPPSGQSATPGVQTQP